MDESVYQKSLDMNSDAKLAFVIVIVAAILTIVIAICLMIRDAKRKRAKLKKINDLLKDHNALEFTVLNHTSGLPIPKGAHCSFYLCEDKLIFEYQSSTFNLSFDKISDLSVYDDIRNSINVAGVLASNSAAYTDLNYSFLITYDSDNELKKIVFDMSIGSIYVVFAACSKYNSIKYKPSEPINVDL